MELKSHISFIKNVDVRVYGRLWRFIRDYRPTTIATVACLGYADGYFRSLSNKGFILLHGESADCGKICMDQFMVDATGIENLKIGDEVTLSGMMGVSSTFS